MMAGSPASSQRLVIRNSTVCKVGADDPKRGLSSVSLGRSSALALRLEARTEKHERR